MNKKPRRTKSLRGIVLLIVALVIVGLYAGYRAYQSKQNFATLREETLEMAILEVAVTSPKPAPPRMTITLPGNLIAWHQAPIYARVSGYVKDWYTDYGARVEKGDLLAILSTPILDAEYRMAKAEVAAQRAAYKLAVVTKKRYVGLADTTAVSQQEASVKTANEKVKKAELNAAIQHLNNIKAKRHFKHVIAPFDGVVIDRNVNVGDFVNEQGSLSLKEGEANMFTVAQMDKIRVFVSVPQAFGPYLKPDKTTDVTVPQLPGRHFTARFKTISKGFVAKTRTALAEFVIDNEDMALWPGSYASVTITAPVDYGLTIPSSALVYRAKEGPAVALVTDDSRIHIKPVEVVRILPAEFVIEGISKTDRFAITPTPALLEGNKVRIVTPRKGYLGQPSLHKESESDPPTQETANKALETGTQIPEVASKRSANNDTLPYRAGPYHFDVALEPKEPRVGKNIVVIYLQDKQGQPIQGATIEATAKMPTTDMQVSAKIREVEPGIYGGLLELPMQGHWPLTLQFKAANAPQHKAVLEMATGRKGLTLRSNFQPTKATESST